MDNEVLQREQKLKERMSDIDKKLQSMKEKQTNLNDQVVQLN